MAKLTFKPGYQDLGPYPLLQPIVNNQGLEVTETSVHAQTPDGLGSGITKTSTRLQLTTGEVLQEYKVVGTLQLQNSASYTFYLGTIVTNGDTNNFGIAPSKIAGSVITNYPCPFMSALANGASVWDDDAEQTIPVESIGIVTIPYETNKNDLLLTAYDSTVATTFSAVVFYEYYFFASEKAQVTLIMD